MIVNSPSKTPKKVITKAALAHGHFVEIAQKKMVSKEFSFLTMSATHPTSEEVEESSFHDFDVSDLDESEAASVLSDNEYIANIMNNSFLSILQPPCVTAAFLKDHDKGLFDLFLAPTFWSGVLKWTNEYLYKNGKKLITMDQLMAYIGLELAMSSLLGGEGEKAQRSRDTDNGYVLTKCCRQS